MKNTVLVLLFCCLGSALFPARAETGSTEDSLRQLIVSAPRDSNRVKLLMQLSTVLRADQVEQAITVDSQAYVLSKEIGYSPGMAQALKGVGIGNYFMGNYAEAIISWREAKRVYEKMGEMRGVANMLSNMGAIYFNQSEYPQAIALFLQALKIAEKEKDTMRIATVWQNIGAVHNEKRDFSQAIEAFEKALPLFKALKYDEGIGLAYLNIGEGYRGEQDLEKALLNMEQALNYLPATNYHVTALRTLGDVQMALGNEASALFYLDSAYRLAENTGDAFELTRTVNTLAKSYQAKGNVAKAIQYFERGKALAQAAAADFEIIIAAKGLVELYAGQEDYKRAFENQEIYKAAQDNIYNVESDKKTNKLLFNFEMEKKKTEIALLVKDKKIQAIEVEKQKGLRNMFLGGFAIVVLFAVVVLRQRNKVKREKKNVEIEKARSEELLLNILPEEVAEELKEKGHSDAQLIDQVTVLFTDFKGFTAISERVSPKELVKDLHECFSAFDHICEKYGIEKIKTIGDAYMAAGGLPVPNTTHAQDVVKAALEMAAVIELGKAKKIQQGLPFFEIRIGVHTGPVVAGIVGVKKFQYDIWGDTVNTASRMESSGAVGQVNISQSTYALLKDAPTFAFESRGKIAAKGKGEIEMYFISKA